MNALTRSVIETGGKQYLVQPGTVLTVERLRGEPGSPLTFVDKLSGRSIGATIVRHGHQPTIRVVRFHNKTRSYRRHGHRQQTTTITITNQPPLREKA
jgi:large subunit ribosomal protein L21